MSLLLIPFILTLKLPVSASWELFFCHLLERDIIVPVLDMMSPSICVFLLICSPPFIFFCFCS